MCVGEVKADVEVIGGSCGKKTDVPLAPICKLLGSLGYISLYYYF